MAYKEDTNFKLVRVSILLFGKSNIACCIQQPCSCCSHSHLQPYQSFIKEWLSEVIGFLPLKRTQKSCVLCSRNSLGSACKSSSARINFQFSLLRLLKVLLLFFFFFWFSNTHITVSKTEPKVEKDVSRRKLGHFHSFP